MINQDLESKLTRLDTIDGELLVIEKEGEILLEKQTKIKKKFENINEEIRGKLKERSITLTEKYEKKREEVYKTLQKEMDEEYQKKHDSLIEEAQFKTRKHVEEIEIITIKLENLRNKIMRLSLEKNELAGVIKHLGGILPEQHRPKIPEDREEKVTKSETIDTDSIPTEITVPKSAIITNLN